MVYTGRTLCELSWFLGILEIPGFSASVFPWAYEAFRHLFPQIPSLFPFHPQPILPSVRFRTLAYLFWDASVIHW